MNMQASLWPWVWMATSQSLQHSTSMTIWQRWGLNSQWRGGGFAFFMPLCMLPSPCWRRTKLQAWVFNELGLCFLQPQQLLKNEGNPTWLLPPPTHGNSLEGGSPVLLLCMHRILQLFFIWGFFFFKTHIQFFNFHEFSANLDLWSGL